MISLTERDGSSQHTVVCSDAEHYALLNKNLAATHFMRVVTRDDAGMRMTVHLNGRDEKLARQIIAQINEFIEKKRTREASQSNHPVS